MEEGRKSERWVCSPEVWTVGAKVARRESSGRLAPAVVFASAVVEGLAAPPAAEVVVPDSEPGSVTAVWLVGGRASDGAEGEVWRGGEVVCE